MKKTILITSIFIICCSNIASGQEITGKWNGALKFMGQQLILSFNVSGNDIEGYTSTMDSPDQKAFGIPTEKTIFRDDTLKISIPAGRIEYQGVLNENQIIKGIFKQNGMTFPLDLSREEIEKEKPKRPQEPTPPYPYYCEDVKFTNSKAGITLAGTLTLPSKDGKYPVVVLISGSGAQDRNEEIMGHKPFLVIADHLTRNGIGVLRFDDRGAGESQGDPRLATTADFATDVEAAVEYLLGRKDINHKKIGLIGHSEGGVIAPMVARNNKKISYIVLLSGTGIRGAELLLMQQELIARANGTSERKIKDMLEVNKHIFDILVNSQDIENSSKEIEKILREIIEKLPENEKPKEGIESENIIKNQILQISSPWMVYFIKYDPIPTLRKVKCPVLALNGSKDLQVPSEANLSAISSALKAGKNKNFTTKELLGLNHLFQECNTGSPNEYATIEQTFSPEALEEITKWILKQTEK